MGVYALTHSIIYYPFATVVLAAFVILFVALKPYRSTIHNVIDSFLVLSMIICYSSVMAMSINDARVKLSIDLEISLMVYLSGLVPLFYIVVLVVYWLVARKEY